MSLAKPQGAQRKAAREVRWHPAFGGTREILVPEARPAGLHPFNMGKMPMPLLGVLGSWREKRFPTSEGSRAGALCA